MSATCPSQFVHCKVIFVSAWSWPMAILYIALAPAMFVLTSAKFDLHGD